MWEAGWRYRDEGYEKGPGMGTPGTGYRQWLEMGVHGMGTLEKTSGDGGTGGTGGQGHRGWDTGSGRVREGTTVHWGDLSAARGGPPHPPIPSAPPPEEAPSTASTTPDSTEGEQSRAPPILGCSFGDEGALGCPDPPPRTPNLPPPPKVATRSRTSPSCRRHRSPPRRKRRMRMKTGQRRREGDPGDPPGNSPSPTSPLEEGGKPTSRDPAAAETPVADAPPA